MNDDSWLDKIRSTIETVSNLPPEEQEKLQDIIDETIERHKQIQESGEKSRIGIKELEELIAELELQTTYNRFDAECLAREIKRKDEEI